jgi:hypothetical protein
MWGCLCYRVCAIAVSLASSGAWPPAAPCGNPAFISCVCAGMCRAALHYLHGPLLLQQPASVGGVSFVCPASLGSRVKAFTQHSKLSQLVWKIRTPPLSCISIQQLLQL